MTFAPSEPGTMEPGSPACSWKAEESKRSCARTRPTPWSVCICSVTVNSSPTLTSEGPRIVAVGWGGGPSLSEPLAEGTSVMPWSAASRAEGAAAGAPPPPGIPVTAPLAAPAPVVSTLTGVRSTGAATLGAGVAGAPRAGTEAAPAGAGGPEGPGAAAPAPPAGTLSTAGAAPSGARPLRDCVPNQNSVVSLEGRGLARIIRGVIDSTTSVFSLSVL